MSVLTCISSSFPLSTDAFQKHLNRLHFVHSSGWLKLNNLELLLKMLLPCASRVKGCNCVAYVRSLVGPGFSLSGSVVVPALLSPCSVLLRDTLRADCTGYGDLVLLAYFIENSHTAIQSTHVIQLWHNADADAWYKHYITATTYIWALHYISHFASWLVFRLRCAFRVCLLFVYTSVLIVRNNYVTYIIAVRLSQLLWVLV